MASRRISTLESAPIPREPSFSPLHTVPLSIFRAGPQHLKPPCPNPWVELIPPRKPLYFSSQLELGIRTSLSLEQWRSQDFSSASAPKKQKWNKVWLNNHVAKFSYGFHHRKQLDSELHVAILWKPNSKLHVQFF